MSDTNTASIPVQDAGVVPGRRPTPAGNVPPTDSTARSSAIMAAGTLVSRILGLVRVALLATAIGTAGAVSDLFPAANNLPTYIFLMIAGGVFNAVLVPQIIRASQQEDRGSDFVSRLMTLSVVVLFILTVLITLAAPFLADLLTNVSGDALALTTIFAYWCLPQIFFYGLYSIIGQVLNANGSFGPYMWAPVVNNIVSIGFLIAFIVMMGAERTTGHTPDTWTSTHTLLLAGGTTLGIVVQALVLIVPLRRLRLGLRPKFGWRGVGLGKTGRLASITIVTMLIGNGLYMVNQWVATIATEARTNLPDDAYIAGLTNLDIGSLVYVLPHSVIALSLATVMFNRLAAAHSQDDLGTTKETLSLGMRTIGVATVFGAAALLALAAPLGMVFSGGIREGGALNALIITLLAVGAPFLSANFFLNRVFYAAEDAITPLKIQLILSVTGVALALTASLFEPALIVPMLALSFTLGNIVAVVVSHLFLVRKIGRYGAGHIYDVHVRLTIAGLVSAAFGAALLWFFGAYQADGFVWQSVASAVVVLLIAGPLMFAVYVGMLKVLRVTELSDFLAPLLTRFRRR